MLHRLHILRQDYHHLKDEQTEIMVSKIPKLLERSTVQKSPDLIKPPLALMELQRALRHQESEERYRRHSISALTETRAPWYPACLQSCTFKTLQTSTHLTALYSTLHGVTSTMSLNHTLSTSSVMYVQTQHKIIDAYSSCLMKE